MAHPSTQQTAPNLIKSSSDAMVSDKFSVLYCKQYRLVADKKHAHLLSPLKLSIETTRPPNFSKEQVLQPRQFSHPQSKHQNSHDSYFHFYAVYLRKFIVMNILLVFFFRIFILTDFTRITNTQFRTLSLWTEEIFLLSVFQEGKIPFNFFFLVRFIRMIILQIPHDVPYWSDTTL